MSEAHREIIQHAVGVVKVAAGGAGVGGTTYAAVSQMTIEHATQIATFCGAVATAVYFTVASLYALWKWFKDATTPKT